MYTFNKSKINTYIYIFSIGHRYKQKMHMCTTILHVGLFNAQMSLTQVSQLRA